VQHRVNRQSALSHNCYVMTYRDCSDHDLPPPQKITIDVQQKGITRLQPI
jgi:hypothetical protein